MLGRLTSVPLAKKTPCVSPTREKGQDQALCHEQMQKSFGCTLRPYCVQEPRFASQARQQRLAGARLHLVRPSPKPCALLPNMATPLRTGWRQRFPS